MRIEILSDQENILGEGPVWDVLEQKLYWVDILGRKIFRINEDGSGFEACSVPLDIGAMALTNDNDIVAALEDGIYRIDFNFKNFEKVIDIESHLTNIRFNDGKVDREGRFIVGSMDRNEKDYLGSLYSINPDYSYNKIEDKIICSNGPCWSPDGNTFYFTDSWTKKIFKYDYNRDDGSINNKKVLFSTENIEGAPDGATVDSEGYIWNAMCFGGVILRSTPNGKFVDKINFPVKKVTSVMFGGKNLDVLYVTTMGKAAEQIIPKEKGGGALFAVYDLGVKGVAERRFGS